MLFKVKPERIARVQAVVDTPSMVLAVLAMTLTSNPAWTVVYLRTVEVDHGDGVYRGTETETVTVTPERRSEQRETSRMKGAPQPAATQVPASTREEITRLLAKLPAGPATYSATRFVDDEGSTSETVRVTVGARTVAYQLVQGGRSPYPPPELVRLYELVTGRTLPAPTPGP